MSNLLTIVNRSSKVLHGTWDGRHYEFAPSKQYAFPPIMCEKFKDQNPVMGSQDPSDPRYTEYLIAIVEYGDDLSPMEQSKSVERWDRKRGGQALEQNVDVVPGRNGLLSGRDVQQSVNIAPSK